MKTIEINGVVRKETSKSELKALRAQGMVPGVIYGHGENTNIAIDERELNKLLFTPDVFNVILKIDGKSYSTIMKEVQFHPVTDRAVHVDFMMVSEDKPITVSLPVTLTGTSIGVQNGGRLSQPLRKLRVTGLLKDLPDSIEVDITGLKIGQSIKVGAQKVKGLKFLDPASNVVVAVKMTRGALGFIDDEEEEEAAAEEGATAEAGETAEAAESTEA